MIRGRRSILPPAGIVIGRYLTRLAATGQRGKSDGVVWGVQIGNMDAVYESKAASFANASLFIMQALFNRL